MPHEPCPYKDQCSHLASAREGMARLGSRLTEMTQLPAPGSIVPCDTLELAKAIRAAEGFRGMLADAEARARKAEADRNGYCLSLGSIVATIPTKDVTRASKTTKDAVRYFTALHAERDTLKERVAHLEGILDGIGAIVQRPKGDPETIAEWVCRTKARVAELKAQVQAIDHASVVNDYRQRDEAHQEQVREAYGRQRDAEERAERLEAQVPRWIPCEERMPEEGQTVLLAYKNEVTPGYLRSGKWWLLESGDPDPMPVMWNSEFGPMRYYTHWQPLPAAPKTEKEG